jgi:predicted metal-binding membrane protein
MRLRTESESTGALLLIVGAAWLVSVWRMTGMLVLLALGAMSVTWMLVVAALVFVEKVPRFGASLVWPVALLLVGLGVVTVMT